MSDVTFQVAGFGAVGLLATLKQLLAAVAASIPKGADSVWSGRMFARRDERGKHEIPIPRTLTVVQKESYFAIYKVMRRK